jgi:hypothetical protein
VTCDSLFQAIVGRRTDKPNVCEAEPFVSAICSAENATARQSSRVSGLGLFVRSDLSL